MAKKAICELPKKATFDDALTLAGYGKFNISVLFGSGGCLMIVIVETMAMMFIVPASQCDLDLSLTTKGVLSAISFLGVVSSSHLWGFIADTRGRRKVLIMSMFASFITSILSSIIPWAWLFILIRYINGFFVGGASAVVYAYVGEFHDKSHRPRVLSWLATFVAFANMLIPGFAWLILPLDFAFEIPEIAIVFRPWRLLVICYGLPSLLFGFWIMKLPESPKYLMQEGKSDEALAILKKMYSINSGRNAEDYSVTEIVWDEFGAEEPTIKKKRGILKSMWIQTVPLFKTPHAIKTLMVCMLQFGAFFSSSGLLMWYPEVLNRIAHFGNEDPGREISMCDAIDYYNEQNSNKNATSPTSICTDSVDVDVFRTSLLIGALFAVLYIFIGSVINTVGAKNLLVGFLVITTSCGLAAQNVNGQLNAEILMALFLTVATCVGIINAIVVELFPTNLRAMALAISLMAGRIGAVAGSNASGHIIYKLCSYTFYFYGLDHIILIILVLLLPSPPKTKKMIEPMT